MIQRQNIGPSTRHGAIRTYSINSGENKVVPKLIGKSALDIAQIPSLFLPNVLQLRFEKRDLVFIRGFLQILSHWNAVFLERVPKLFLVMIINREL